MGKLRSQAGAVFDQLGLPAEVKYAFRWAGHVAGVRKDGLVQLLGDLDHARKASAPVPAPSGRPVLIWTVRGGPVTSTIEALLARAIEARGVPAIAMRCGAALPACENRIVAHYPSGAPDATTDRALCSTCSFVCSQQFARTHVRSYELSEVLGEQDHRAAEEAAAGRSTADLFALKVDGYDLGPIIRSSTIRFFLNSRLDLKDPFVQKQAENYARAAVLILRSAEAMIARTQPRALLTSHGVYVSWGIPILVAQRRGVPVVAWARGWQPGSILVGQGESYFGDLAKEPSSLWEGLDLDQFGRREKLTRFLTNRWKPGNDSVAIFEGSKEDASAIRADLSLDPAKTTLALFPNITWDAEIFWKNIAYPSLPDWLIDTVRRVARQDNLQLVVRAHPMEVRGMTASRERIGDTLSEAFPELPANVRFVPPDSDINSYALAEVADVCLVHASQIGIELACRGKPIVLTGGCSYRGKGFTIDIETPEEYGKVIENADALRPLSPEQVERALRYAYHYYYRRMLPVGFPEVRGRSEYAGLGIRSFDELAPGASVGLDRLMDALLQGGPTHVDV